MWASWRVINVTALSGHHGRAVAATDPAAR
jgi:hypothetical protein